MATATTTKVSVADSGVFHASPREDSASVAGQVLQDDMKKHDIFFNTSGFHNHTVHHVLSIFALGATPKDIQAVFDRAASYQLPAHPVSEDTVKKLSNKAQFKAYSGKRAEYANFLEFFQREINSKGVPDVVNEYLFAGDENADEMLLRLFAGLLHPFIHLGFGLEFNQPAIVAQGLAQTAVHELYLRDCLLPAEVAAGGAGQTGKKSLVQIEEEIRSNSALRSSAKWADDNKMIDGVMTRALPEMIRVCSEFSVGPEQMDERVAEMINSVAYFTGTSLNPEKKIKFDFFYMHCLNSAIFLPVFIAQPWISQRNKLRILEWKGRMDLLVYTSRGCPEPRLSDITNYKITMSWDEIFNKTIAHGGDDGHAAKFIRLLAYGEKACKPYEEKEAFKIKGDMWLKLANMVVDSIQGPERLWLQNVGFPEAWTDIPAREKI